MAEYAGHRAPHGNQLQNDACTRVNRAGRRARVCRACSLLEKSLFGFCLGLLFAGLLIVLANPPIKLKRPALRLSPAAAAMRNRRRLRGARTAPVDDVTALKVSARDMSDLTISTQRDQWAANEFAFEHAIEAYEELIDTTAERRT